MAGWEGEARDDHGRWTSGGGSNLDPYQTNPPPTISEAPAPVWEAAFVPPSGVEGNGMSGESTGDLHFVEGYVEGDGQFNADLRSTEGVEPGSYSEEAVHGLERAINTQKPTTEDTVLYRGLGGFAGTGEDWSGTAPDYAHMEVGEIGKDPGFSSTSSDRAVAEEFRGEGQNPDHPLLEIRVPAGAQALHIPSAVKGNDALTEEFAYQSEVLLPRGSGFQILEQLPDRTVVQLLKP